LVGNVFGNLGLLAFCVRLDNLQRRGDGHIRTRRGNLRDKCS
jgi:hypothetical protein